MKIYTSYFYQVRHFTPNMIPLSTAVSDPKWYHQEQGNKHWFIDKNGVINGLRAPVFAPGSHISGLCRGHEGCAFTPDSCLFLTGYANQLASLDFDDIIERIESIANRAAAELHLREEPIVVLLVHEAPTNPCGERVAIQNWFKSHGVNCEEYDFSAETKSGMN